MESQGLTACSVWVPRGAPKAQPTKLEVTEDDLARLMEETKEQLRDATLEDEDADDVVTDDDDDDDDDDEGDDNNEGDDTKAMKEEEGDDDDDDKDAEMDAAEDDDEDAEDVTLSGANLSSIKGLTYYKNQKDDPYITLDKDDDEEDFTISPTDNMLVLGRIDDGLGRLEMHIWNEEEDSLFPHTDVMLSSFPVCMEWVGYDPGNDDDNSTGNILALGTMEPQIELWDLDVLEAPEPAVTLGKPKKTKKGKKKVCEAYPGHRDAVLGLAWNRGQRTLLASASADTTVRLWDLNSTQCMRTYTHHTTKVENVKWNPQEVAVLATGAHGGHVSVFDTRTPEAVATWELDGDVECLEWCPWDPAMFIAGTSNGTVFKCSARAPGKPVFTLKAHDAAVSCVALSPQIEGLMATGSPDEHVKVWDVKDKPSMILSKDYDLGPVFTMGFCPDSGYQLACGGHHGGAKIVHLVESGPVLRRFRDRNTDFTKRAEKLAKEVAEQRAAEVPEAPDADEDAGDERAAEEAIAYNPRVAGSRRK
ncbi:hypothetical protein PTSG_04319 [Salpingoeca rosetta]|uniref:Uncharacterized protein n=1 Tax=Salpingoeca rosetta (strain ATCC 50818 / BSB-021) TaxID=946362 RepID=F2U875_SALR5|nr:uncharacterized protein PTSG_04319 [Salpingoeca rosetta]EGD72583.1 hypothetical protein PTSG_04319 [Salpingoeca rosetta]|eukprot:XP_004994406.1 hypothetical protein PTSG_04319 [Salpingoeca rosetta]